MKLLFVLSQPRTGSTLLQRMLMAHSQVGSVGEPYLLYPYLWFLHDGPVCGNVFPAVRSQLRFRLEEPAALDAFRQALRQFAVSCYTAMARETPAWFVDKSVCYGQVARQMCATFPDDQFVVLWRNPLATAASLMRHDFGGERSLAGLPLRPSGFRHISLYASVDELCRLAEAPPPHVAFLRYEDLVTDAAAQLSRVCAQIGLPFERAMVEDFAKVQLDSGDPDRGRADRQKLNPASLEKWTGFYNNPVRRYWARGYLRWIGDERLQLMGYDRATLLAALERVPAGWTNVAKDVYWLARTRLDAVFETELLRGKVRARRFHRVLTPMLPQTAPTAAKGA